MPTSPYKNIGWSVGSHCNARCGHCYSWKIRRGNAAYLTEADVERVISQLVSLGVETVNLGGNEPIYTHGPDIQRTILPLVIRSLREAGLPVGLTTNGVTFTYLERRHPDVLGLLNDIDFSLDSPFAAEHDANRGVPLYTQTVQAITRCREMGIDCSIVTCGMKGNFDRGHLGGFLALCKALDAELRINLLKPVERTLLAEMPSAAQFYDGFAYLMQHTDCTTLGEACITAFTGTGMRGCPCGSSSFRINAKTPQGRIPVSPCVYLHDFQTGDLLRDDIHDIVRSPEFELFRRRDRELPRACRDADCEYLDICRGGCLARTYLVHGDVEARDPYCPLDHVRATGHAPDLPVAPAVGRPGEVRVHDNYLCTWIGGVSASFEEPTLRTIDAFHEPPGAARPDRLLSGCRQSDDGDDPYSLPRQASTGEGRG